MVYTIKLANSTLVVDSEKVAELYRAKRRMYVQPSSDEERLKLTERLEGQGFKCAEGHQSRGDMIASRLPLSINLEEKIYSLIWNTTCAAAAASCRVVVTEREYNKLCCDEQ